MKSIVSRVLILPLVFVLSGVPAAAVVCDLMLCADPAKSDAASTGCHDHATPTSAKRMSARDGDCTHISTADPYVASGSRVACAPVTSPPLASMSYVPVTFRCLADVSPGHARSSSRAASSLPLRI
jgi:hypothetical protein